MEKWADDHTGMYWEVSGRDTAKIQQREVGWERGRTCAYGKFAIYDGTC